MANLAEAFEQHLRSLSDQDWDALVSRVRQPAPTDPPPRVDNEVEQTTEIGSGKNAGLAEAKRRGFIKDGEKK